MLLISKTISFPFNLNHDVFLDDVKKIETVGSQATDAVPEACPRLGEHGDSRQRAEQGWRTAGGRLYLTVQLPPAPAVHDSH